MRNLLANIGMSSIFSVFVACGGTDLNKVVESGGIDSAGFQNQAYVDTDPDISDSGQKVVFVSFRDDEIPKVYKFENGVLGRATSSDIGYENKGRVSPDGNLISILVTDSEGQSRLYVQTWDGSVIGEVAGPTGIIRFEDFAFSDDSSGLVYLAFVESAEGELPSINYVKISLSSEFSLESMNISTNEWEPRITNSGGIKYVVARSINDQFRSIYNTYQINDSGSLSSTLVWSSSPVKTSSGALLGVGSSGVYYKESLETSRVKERLGDTAPIENESSRGYVSISKGIAAQGLTGSSGALDFTNSNFLAYEPSETYSVQEIDGTSIGILGGDYYICTNGSIFLSTFQIYNLAENIVLPFTFSENDETGAFEGILVETCNRMIVNRISLTQPFERKVKRVVLKGSLAGGYHMVVESWESGDGEIYRVSFNLASLSSGVLSNDNILSQTVTEISANPITLE